LRHLKTQLMNKLLRSLIEPLVATTFSDGHMTHAAINFNNKTQPNPAALTKVARHRRIEGFRICSRNNTQTAQVRIGQISLTWIRLFACNTAHPLL